MATFQLFFRRVGLKTYQHPCKLEHGATIVAMRHFIKKTRPFNLCVCDVTIICMVGGLGVEGQENGPREFPILQHFVVLNDTASLMIETKNT